MQTRALCHNCKRIGVETYSYPCELVRRKNRKKFYNVDMDGVSGSRDKVTLCVNCSKYLFNSKNVYKEYWPSMVFSFLEGEPLDGTVGRPFNERWQVIPRKWRIWWKQWFSAKLLAYDSLQCSFVDVTEEAERLNEAIAKLEWVELAKAMDKHMAYPEVRCPFGCSEYLHKVNSASFEDFLWHYSGFQTKSYCQPVGTVWTDCISPAFPSTALILEKFPCRPSVIIGDDGPEILMCREHSNKSNNFYFHVPESATGSIYTPNANAFAPVVIRPRTNRNFKRNVRSDTFCTVDQVGGYCGVDSSYITSSNVLRSDGLSSKRDSLSLQGRPDVKAQLYDRALDMKNPAYIPSETIKHVVEYAERQFPESLESLNQWNTSTYIECEKAIELQEKAYGDGSKTIRVYNSETDSHENKLFVPPWPVLLLKIHPIDDHGQRFQRIMESDFGIWCLLSMTTAVSELWESVVETVSETSSWDGHWLRFASSHLRLLGTRRNCGIFNKKTKKDINEMFRAFSGGSSLSEILKNRDLTASIFQKCDEVLVVEHHLPSEEELRDRWGSKTIVICISPRKPIGQGYTESFELRCLLSSEEETRRNTFQMHVRHRGKKLWVQNGTSHCMKKDDSSPSDQAWRNANIGIYCRVARPKFENLKNRYMNLIGGQSHVYCKIHKCPFVLNHRKKSRNGNNYGCACKKEGMGEHCLCHGAYICPYYSICGSAICRDHMEEARTRCEEPDTVFYLSREGQAYKKHLVEEDGGIRGVDGDADFLPEGYGPVAGFEQPQDFLEDQYDDGDECEQGGDDDELGQMEMEGNDNATETFEHAVNSAFREHGEGQQRFGEATIPCTRLGAEQPAVHVQESVVSSGSVPLYVLLNMQGHLLTRSRSKLRMSSNQRAIFEKLVARSHSNVVPLVYGEAQLFPSIFWQSFPDGTIPGAIPTAMWCDADTLRRFGVASMRQHSKQRITNPACLTSVDPSYHFLQMDVNVNLGLRGKDTRIVLNRGFADSQGSDGIKFKEKSDAAELHGETMENHANVHKLSALVRERKPHFFFTQSCNQESCGGLRVLRDWVTSAEARQLLQTRYNLNHDEADRFLRESAASYILRSWNEVADLWMKYIIYSPEAPLGEIEYGWYRKEFQEKQGNPSHIHAILKTIIDIATPEGLQAVLSKIRGCVADLIHTTEAMEMEGRGILSSAGQLVEILETARAYLTHRCHERCQIPTRTSNGETVWVCKVNDNFLKTYTPTMHTIQQVRVYHTAEAKAIYNRLGFMEGELAVHECLCSDRHVPICSKHDPKFSPTNGHLFACYRSSQNLQFTTGHAIAAYLVKYVAGFDEVAIAVVRAMKKDQATGAEAVVHSLKNTKITRNNMRAKRIKSKLKNTARILTQMECLTVVLGASLVTSTEQFIHMPTSPREYRSAFFKNPISRGGGRPWDAWEDGVDDFIDADVVRGQWLRERLKFPRHRWFSDHQLDVIRDEKDSSLSIDAITVFSIRPPELRFVNSVRLYLRWFRRIPTLRPMPRNPLEYESMMRKRLNRDLARCEWIDGLDMKIVLRRGAIREILSYIKDRDLCTVSLFRNSFENRAKMTQLLELIDKLYRQFELGEVQTRRKRTVQSSSWQYKLVCEKFLDEDKSNKLPTVWTTPVFPKNKGRFLISLLLTFGRFETEYELMLQGNMKLAYQHAGLFDRDEPNRSVDELMKKYVEECLSYLPGSIFQRDKHLCFADSALSELLLDESENAIVMETPCVLQSMMEHSTDQRVRKWRKDQITMFMNSLHDSLAGAGFKDFEVPDKEKLMAMHFPLEEDHGLHRIGSPRGEVPYMFPPLYREESPQSRDSYEEQRKVLLSARNIISRYKTGSYHKNMIICGGPGNGKTTVCEEICMYAFSQGLSGMVTSIVADRSKTLGGIHIHSLCSIPISERHNQSPGRTAEAAIATMYRKPHLLYLWRKMDFLCIDEFGAVSAEMLATIDIIARHAKESNKFMGGILLVCTMDPRQLLPVTGTAVMLSMNMMTEFLFVELTESVRAANDRNLQRICSLSRKIDWNDQEKDEFKRLIRENCNFVMSLNDESIPEDAIFVFGRKSPCMSVEESILQRVERNGTRVIRCMANDEESSFAGNWRPASDAAQALISKRVKEKKELCLFETGRYEFTYNMQGVFQQGQLAILLHLNEIDIRLRNKLKFYKGPAGCKEFPPLSEFTHEKLTERGWEQVLVPFECSQATRIGSMLLGRRTQYGVRLRVASTIHACQGATFSKLVTAVTNLPGSDLNFTLWEAAQVIVLISRTRRCSDIYFVGDEHEVANRLVETLCETGRYLRHIQALTKRLCGELDATPVLERPPIFRPCDMVLDRESAVYLLVSTKHAGFMYIGETEDIRKRLNDHNSGNGSKFTNNSRLRPWALFGFVIGFGNRSQRRLFEQRWKHRAREDRNSERRRNPAGVLQIAIDLAIAKNRTRLEHSKLLVRRCGEMVDQQQPCVLVES